MGRGGRGFIKIHGDLKALPYLLTHIASHGHAIFDGDAIDGDKGDDVGCAHARVRALMLAHIDELRRFLNPAESGFHRGVERLGDEDVLAVWKRVFTFG